MPLKTQRQGQRPAQRPGKAKPGRPQYLKDLQRRMSSSSTSRERAIANAGKKTVDNKKSGVPGLIKGFAQDVRGTVTGKAYQLARKRKPTGRLNTQDLEDARNAILGIKKSKKGTKIMKRRGGGIVKRGMGMAK
mgnify:CR=1 FL=1